ncbi:hypothetical protein F8388_003768 [Cannabis sativa]|uniref:Uncharacterized protein n=1 Tax=Cannabis sativa TaxID=3483 RepID=A0A7J6DU02_CANSA|nr:hypothetical protein F8388_003768 [Cannabis sativa]
MDSTPSPPAFSRPDRSRRLVSHQDGASPSDVQFPVQSSSSHRIEQTRKSESLPLDEPVFRSVVSRSISESDSDYKLRHCIHSLPPVQNRRRPREVRVNINEEERFGFVEKLKHGGSNSDISDIQSFKRASNVVHGSIDK